jgi:DUF917 family protein
MALPRRLEAAAFQRVASVSHVMGEERSGRESWSPAAAAAVELRSMRRWRMGDRLTGSRVMGLALASSRLSSVRDADQVVYMEEGRVISSGKFEDVRREVPNFDHQAKLMGL